MTPGACRLGQTGLVNDRFVFWIQGFNRDRFLGRTRSRSITYSVMVFAVDFGDLTK